MKVLIDTNVLLDVLLQRQPWAAESQAVWDASDATTVHGHISALSVPNLFYIARRIVGVEKARESVALLLTAFDIVPIAQTTLEAAFAMAGSDFEDDLRIASALSAGVNAIVTRDARGFSRAGCAVITPAELLAQLARTKS